MTVRKYIYITFFDAFNLHFPNPAPLNHALNKTKKFNSEKHGNNRAINIITCSKVSSQCSAELSGISGGHGHGKIFIKFARTKSDTGENFENFFGQNPTKFARARSK